MINYLKTQPETTPIMPSIQLNFINNSLDTNDNTIVIFQKNEAPGFNETAVAWTVIQHCDIGDNHPFQFSMNLFVSAEDGFGNFSPQLLANPGDSFKVSETTSGHQLSPDGPADNLSEIDVKNLLPSGAISANIFRDGKLLAIKTNVVPGQMATFVFRPTLYIGIVFNVQEGDVMNSAIVSTINTQISLLGIASADIVMTGGGQGPSAKPYQFTLQNVKMA